MAQLELDHKTEGSATRVTVRGEIDMATAPQLNDLLNALIDAGSSDIVLEARGLEFLDSTGIGVLVAARNRLGNGGTLSIASPPPHVRKVLELTGADVRMPIVP